MGKSTLLSMWGEYLCHMGDPDTPLPLFVRLAGAGADADPHSLLMDAAGLSKTSADRAALALLIRAGRLLPIFDGLDEMATRVDPAALAQSFTKLLAVAEGKGKVVISCRDPYFPNEADLKGTTEQSLAHSLGNRVGYTRFDLQPFSPEMVAQAVTKWGGPEATTRLASLNPPLELDRQPLLLRMVLNTLGSLPPGQTLTRGDLYESYFRDWVEKTSDSARSLLTNRQKEMLAEVVAEELWRSGSPSCSAADLQRVLLRLAESERDLQWPAGVDLHQVINETFGGTFFIREGSDRFRFAHRSLQEFLLARVLVRTVPERPVEVIRQGPITREIAGFVAELLRSGGATVRGPFLNRLQEWLSQGRKTSPVEATAAAAANVVRLLLGLERVEATPRVCFPPAPTCAASIWRART